MLLVIPVSLSDYKSIPEIEKAFGVFSPGAGHKLLVIGSPNVTAQVKSAAQSLCGHFAGNASTYIFDYDCDLGWPGGCNYYFQQANWYMQSNHSEPWFWFELDTTPTRAGWLDEIENAVHVLTAEAQREGRAVPRYFGAEEPARLEYQGALMPNAGTQMAAVGVYPADMSDVLSLRAISATNIPWNTFLRWYIMPSFGQLPQIQNNWQTARYRLNPEGQIESDSVARWAWDVHFNKPIDPEAALVHGCKDGSLLAVLQQTQTPEPPESEYWTDYKDPTQQEKVERLVNVQRKLTKK